MSINGETLDLVLEVVSTTEGMFSIGKHLYFTYITNLKGLEEFIGKYTRNPFLPVGVVHNDFTYILQVEHSSS